MDCVQYTIQTTNNNYSSWNIVVDINGRNNTIKHLQKNIVEELFGINWLTIIIFTYLSHYSVAVL